MRRFPARRNSFPCPTRRPPRQCAIPEPGRAAAARLTEAPGIPILVTATLVGFLAQLNLGMPMLRQFALWPLGAGFMPWQLVSYAFLHGSLAHLVFNLIGLWMFGRELETLLGRRWFYILYFTSVLAAAALQLLFAAASGSVYPTVGASGGVFGVLLAFALFFPNRIVVLLIPPVPMPAWLFATLYAAIELFLGVTGTQAGVAHFAHLGGMAGGYLVIRLWRTRRRRWR